MDYNNRIVFYSVVMKSFQDKIQAIDSKILELSKVYHEDIGASLREASQTQDMITLLKRQKYELQKDMEKGSAPIKKFILETADGEKITFNVVTSNPDRTNNEISMQSQMGSQLISSSLNDIIFFKDKEFRITLVE